MTTLLRAISVPALLVFADLHRRRCAAADALSEEAAFLERYFEIQRMRFGNRLRTSINLEPGTEDTEVPALLLQPLVENAFRHGLADRLEEGCIHVRASRTSTGALTAARPKVSR